MNLVGRITAVLASFYVFFFLPLHFYAMQMDGLLQIFVQAQTERFVDEVKVKGIIQKDTYLDFIDTLEASGNLYEITMEHSHIITDFKEGEEKEEYMEYGQSCCEDEIVKEIFSKKEKYRMSKGDYFSIGITNRNETGAGILEKMLFGRKSRGQPVYVTAGGRIRNEAF